MMKGKDDWRIEMAVADFTPSFVQTGHLLSRLFWTFHCCLSMILTLLPESIHGSPFLHLKSLFFDLCS